MPQSMVRCRPVVRVLVVAVLVAGAAGNASARVRGPERTAVTEVIVHATGGPSCQRGRVVYSDPGTVERMRAFFARSGRLGIHYIIGRDGRVVSGVPEGEVAIHTMDNNATSIGIELINRGDGLDPFPTAQVEALTRLLTGIRGRYGLGIEAIRRHSDVDHTTFPCGGRLVRRKQDPGHAFPWERLLLSLLTLETEPHPTSATARVGAHGVAPLNAR